MAKSKAPEVAQPSMPDKDDYEADDALRTLERAEEVRGNAELMKRVAKKAGRKVKALSSIVGKQDTFQKPKNLDELRMMAHKKMK